MNKKYAGSQIFLHWITFIAVIVVYFTMLCRNHFAPHGSSLRDVFNMTHFSAGITILIIMLLRIVLRTRHRSPAIEPKPAHWQIGLSHLVHLAIYLFFIIMPVLGILSRYYAGQEWSAFGISMPFSSNADPDFSKQIKTLHKTLSELGYWLVGLHAAAALLHHYVMKDNTLLRMMPGKK